jgi:phenylalanyl-tRNA synthetase beta chain
MPTITLKKDVLEKLMGKKLPLEELKDRISMIGTDLERIEGNEIIVEIFPNRPDMLCEAGFARALSSFIGVKTGLVEYKATKVEGPEAQNYRVIIDKSVKDVRPFTACAIVKGLKFDDEKIREIIQLQEKLHVTYGRDRKKAAIGIYPLEKIKLPIRYLARKPQEIKFRPLESAKEMTGQEILEHHPTGKEFAHLLDGQKMFPIFIDSNDEILSMPPIINSHKTGKVTEKTTEVFIECSGFDFRTLSLCLNIIVTSLADLGGEIFEMKLEYEKSPKKTPILEPTEWPLDTAYLNKMLGLELKDPELKKLFEKMGFGMKGKKVLVPCYRTDILHQIDLAEDVAIAYGYENFEPEIPNVATVGEEDALEIFKGRVADILVGLGFIETISYNLSNKDIDSKKMLLSKDKDAKAEGSVELENSVTADRSILRSWILPSLMQVLSENTNREYPQNIFEMGTGFRLKTGTEMGVDEEDKLGIALCNTESDFTKIKQVAETICNALGAAYELEKVEHPSFIQGRAANLMINKKKVGIMGEISPGVITNFRIPMPVSAMELDLKALHGVVYSHKKKSNGE